MMYIFFHKAKSSAGRRGLFCMLRFMRGCVVFNILLLNFFQPKISVTVSSLGTFRLLHIPGTYLHMNVTRVAKKSTLFAVFSYDL